MTMPFEPEEPEAVVLTVENSHLVRGSCVRCHAPALCDPSQLSKALCTGCLGSGAAFSPGELPYTVPVGYPPTYGYGRAESAGGHSQHPKPEFSGELMDPERLRRIEIETPESVLSLARLARAHGWEVRVRYSRGHGQHATTGRPAALSHSLAVAIGGREGTQRQAVAVYVRPVSGGTWTWKTVYAWGPDLSWLKTNREDLDLFIEDPQGCAPELRRRQTERLKAKAANKPCPARCGQDHEHRRPAAKKRESGG